LPNDVLRELTNARCCPRNASAAARSSRFAAPISLAKTALMSRSRRNSSGDAQMAFSAASVVVRQLKLCRFDTAISAPSRSRSRASAR